MVAGGFPSGRSVEIITVGEPGQEVPEPCELGQLEKSSLEMAAGVVNGKPTICGKVPETDGKLI